MSYLERKLQWQKEFIDSIHDEPGPEVLPPIRVTSGSSSSYWGEIPEPSYEPLGEFDPAYYSRLELGPYKPPAPDPDQVLGDEDDQDRDDWRRG